MTSPKKAVLTVTETTVVATVLIGGCWIGKSVYTKVMGNRRAICWNVRFRIAKITPQGEDLS